VKISEVVFHLLEFQKVLGDVDVKIEDHLLGDYWPTSISNVLVGCKNGQKHVDIIKGTAHD